MTAPRFTRGALTGCVDRVAQQRHDRLTASAQSRALQPTTGRSPHQHGVDCQCGSFRGSAQQRPDNCPGSWAAAKPLVPREPALRVVAVTDSFVAGRAMARLQSWQRRLPPTSQSCPWEFVR